MVQDGNAEVDQSTNAWDARSVLFYRFGNHLMPQVPDSSVKYVFGAGRQGFPISQRSQTGYFTRPMRLCLGRNGSARTPWLGVRTKVPVSNVYIWPENAKRVKIRKHGGKKLQHWARNPGFWTVQAHSMLTDWTAQMGLERRMLTRMLTLQAMM